VILGQRCRVLRNRRPLLHHPDPGYQHPQQRRQRAEAACARSAELQQRTTHVLTEVRAARRTSAEARRQRRSSPAGRDLMQQFEHVRELAAQIVAKTAQVPPKRLRQVTR
jgi:hypothetical protein